MYRPFRSVSFSLLSIFVSYPVLISGTFKPGSVIKNREALPIISNTASGTLSGAIATPFSAANAKTVAPEPVVTAATRLYDSLQLKRFGLGRKAFEYAWKGYQFLIEKGRIVNDDILSICDFSQSSRRKRLYVIDLSKKKVLVNTYVAHGRRSGGEYARSFSNSPESHKSSLGFYVTRQTYYGDHGLALKIDGLENGINDLADARNIVIHGSKYVGKNFLAYNRFNGRSFGCPAVPAMDTHKVIHTIKNGSCLFIYHPNKNYLTKSRILNNN